MANESKEALKLMQDNGCDVLDIKFIDLPGIWQHVSVPISEVTDSLFANGTGFDGSSIRGFQSIDESDMLLVPDKSTVKIDPFVDGHVTVIADIKDPVSGELYSKDPRNVAKKAQEYLKSTGIGDTSFGVLKLNSLFLILLVSIMDLIMDSIMLILMKEYGIQVKAIC